MNLHEVLELIQLRKFERDPVQRLINRTHMPDDFRVVAKRKLLAKPKRPANFCDYRPVMGWPWLTTPALN